MSGHAHRACPPMSGHAHRSRCLGLATGYSQWVSAAPSFRLELPCEANAGRGIRGAMRRLLGLVDQIEDLLLIVSELVNNAVLHSGCRPGDTIEVSLLREDDHILISVRDPGRAGGDAHIRGPDASPFKGIGLRLVEQLARRWGAERENGYRVWAEIPLA
jgi:anti-sigma regulatory factor (Ser/Thr protein kinase)